jgi:hypothetical protein
MSSSLKICHNFSRFKIVVCFSQSTKRINAKSKYINSVNVEHEMFLHTSYHWGHWNCNYRNKTYENNTRNEINTFCTKYSCTRDLKSEVLSGGGAPLVQEKYQRKGNLWYEMMMMMMMMMPISRRAIMDYLNAGTHGWNFVGSMNICPRFFCVAMCK